jgi:hypothetical protein
VSGLAINIFSRVKGVLLTANISGNTAPFNELKKALDTL